MSRAIWLTLSALVLLAVSSASAKPATDQNKLICKHTAGYIQEPFVPTESVARQIYLAILRSITKGAWSRPHSVTVTDDGDRWSVFENRPVKDAHGQEVVVMGGGGIAMTIDKCTGAILNASYQR